MILKYLPKKALLLTIGDTALIALAFFISPSIRYLNIDLYVGGFSWRIILITGIYLSIFHLTDLYDFDELFVSLKYFLRFISIFLIGTTLVAAISLFFEPQLRPGRGIFLIAIISTGILTYLWRLIFEWIFKRFIEQPKRILIIGAGKAGTSLYKTIKDNSKFEIVGFVDDDTQTWGYHQSSPVLGNCSTIPEAAAMYSVDLAIISIIKENDTNLLKQILDCKMRGVTVLDLPSFYEELTGKIPIEHVTDAWLIDCSLAAVKRSFYNQKVKRLLDVCVSLLFILLFSPMHVLIAIAIKLDSKGPIFYKQTRVGLNSKIFKIVKYRSMIVDAESNGIVWTEKGDNRITRVGKLMRKFRIDEIPQAWNVLRKEMSFIGPRPERPEFVNILERTIPYYTLRHFIKPGLTGWAQVNHPYSASEEDTIEKLKYDLFYIKNCSPLLDLYICLKTFKVVLFGHGAR